MPVASDRKYFLALRPGAAVGPHSLDSLREWVALGAISPDLRVCRQGEETWATVGDIPGFSFFPQELQDRLNEPNNDPGGSGPPSEEQLEKLNHFEIPFDSKSLTAGRAARLLEVFAALDPRREEQYLNRPATAAQEDRIRALGGDFVGVSYCEAEMLIKELEAKVAEEERLAAVVEQMALLDSVVNDRTAQDTWRYRRLAKYHLQELLAYLTDHHPGWREMDSSEICQHVPRLFPTLVQIRRPAPKVVEQPHESKTGLASQLMPLRDTLVALISRIVPSAIRKAAPPEDIRGHSA